MNGIHLQPGSVIVWHDTRVVAAEYEEAQDIWHVYRADLTNSIDSQYTQSGRQYLGGIPAQVLDDGDAVEEWPNVIKGYADTKTLLEGLILEAMA